MISEEEKLIATLATQIHLENRKKYSWWNVEDSVEKAKQIIEASKKPEPGLTPITRKKLVRKTPKESPVFRRRENRKRQLPSPKPQPRENRERPLPSPKPQPRDMNRKRPLPSPPVRKKRVILGK